MRAINKLCVAPDCCNIVEVFRQGEAKDAAFHYIDMELCNENLSQYMREHEEKGLQITMREIWNIMGQIANGLEFIHRHGEVHRDLKPRNGTDLCHSKLNSLIFHAVLLSRKSQMWKIADFGLTSEGTSHHEHTTASSRGTVGYRAPELIREDRAVYNNKVDIWSLGCILYELVWRRKAFPSDWDVLRYYDGHEKIDLPEISNKLCRPWLSIYVRKMLSRFSEERPWASYFRSNFAFHYLLDHRSHWSKVLLWCSRPSIAFSPILDSLHPIVFTGCPSTSRFAVRSSDAFILVYDVERGMSKTQLQHNDVKIIEFSSSATNLLASYGSSYVVIWDLETSARLYTFHCAKPLHSISFNKNGTKVGVGVGITPDSIQVLDITNRGAPGTTLADRQSVAIIPPGRSFVADRDWYLRYHGDELHEWTSTAGNNEHRSIVRRRILDSQGQGTPSTNTTWAITTESPAKSLLPSSTGDKLIMLLEVGFEVFHTKQKAVLVVQKQNVYWLNIFSPCTEYVLVVPQGGDGIEVWSCKTGRRVLVTSPSFDVKHVKRLWFGLGERKILLVVTEVEVVAIDFYAEICNASSQEGLGDDDYVQLEISDLDEYIDDGWE